jgi:hypothetical protein
MALLVILFLDFRLMMSQAFLVRASMKQTL